MSSFQLVGLPHQPFERLFDLSDRELAEVSAVRVTAGEKPGFPCRISLADAEVGEELLLLPFSHQPANSPYKASGPIYVRRRVRQRILEAGEIPDCVHLRLMSLRAYDDRHMIVSAAVCEGREVAAEIERHFNDEQVRYIHLHNARRGCYSCLVRRVPAPAAGA